ncbi:Scn11a [Symbiodinium sp. CCMP2456]|nr:Scn11a [Symbiodinium sp. CCMP2456]
MSSFHELLSQLQVRYESDVASLTAQCHRLLRENVELREEQEPEVPSEVAVDATAEAELAPVSNHRTAQPSMFSQSGITGTMQFPSKKPRALPKTHSARLDGSRIVREITKSLEWWSSLEEPKRSGFVYKLVESRSFWCLSIFVILVNAFSITRLIDISLAEDAGGPGALLSVELFCLTFYIVELVLRLLVHRLYFFINDNLAWNWLDLLLVAFSIIEIIVIWRTDGQSGTILYMRTLRICKVSKAVRIFRVLTAFRELAGLLENLRSSLMAMFWSLALLSFLLFLSALIFAQGVADGLSDAVFPASDAKQLGFDSVGDTMVLLYMSVTGGTDWHLYYDLLKMLDSFYHWLYLGFIFFFTFALFNILTATFVEKAVDASRPDRQQQMVLERRKFAEQAAELRELFSKMDRDNNGRITKDEFDECLEDGEVLSHMLSVGLDVYDAHYLFELVADQTGQLEISRFVDGCMAVKGSASALDIQKQMVLIGQLESRLDSWEKDYWPPMMSFAAGVHLKL